jgi:two-component system sensor histidine kinase VicK
MEFIEFRHLDGIRSNVGIADKMECLIHVISHDNEHLSHAIISNSKGMVEAQQYLFDTLWNKALPAEQKIREIEEGIKPPFIETIRDPSEIQNLSFDLVRSAKVEVLILFSTINSFYRQKRTGMIRLLEEASDQRQVRIRILIPLDDKTKTEELLQMMKDENYIKIEILRLQSPLQTKVTTLVVDRKLSLEVEGKDDSKDNPDETMGLATYSNSEATVWTHASIFETLWIQSELYSGRR